MLEKAINCLRAGSLITLLVDILIVSLGVLDNISKNIFFCILSLFLISWYEITARGLKKRRTWAWKSAIVIFGLYIPTLLIIPGILGMQVILTKSSRDAIFGTDAPYRQGNAPTFADVMSQQSNYKKDESLDEYILNNDALRRYMSYKKDNNDAES